MNTYALMLDASGRDLKAVTYLDAEDVLEAAEQADARIRRRLRGGIAGRHMLALPDGKIVFKAEPGETIRR